MIQRKDRNFIKKMIEEYADPSSTLTAGKGINILDRKINMSLGSPSGLEFTSSDNVRVKAGEGLRLDSNGVNIDLTGATDGQVLSVEIIDGVAHLKWIDLP